MPVQRFGHRLTIWSTIFALVFAPGCSRKFWREQAEKDTYNAVAEKLDDQRWTVPRTSITPDKRSRFYDPYDPDQAPLPPDDPAAQKFMRCANGIKGYKSWHKFGDTISVENPQWLEPFGVSLDGNGDIDPVTAHSSVALKEITLEEAIELSYIHSRTYQTNIENLYLNALDLTFQRFQFGVRYLNEPTSSLNSTSAPGFDTWGAGQSFGLTQALPAGGQWAVELANNTLWLFGAGGGTPVSSSNLGFSLVQPLLFRAGRNIALEGLTQSERNVLYSARELARFRKEFFVDTTSSYLGILEQKQGIINRKNNIMQLEEQIAQGQFEIATRKTITVSAPLETPPPGFAIPESLDGKLSYNDAKYLEWRGLTISDEEEEEIRSVSDDAAYQRAALELINVRRGQLQTTQINILQLLTRLSAQQNALRGDERRLQDTLDFFKIQLGLPPDVTLDLDTALLEPFKLISPELTETELGIKDTLEIVRRERGVASDFATLKRFLDTLNERLDELANTAFPQVNTEFNRVDAIFESEGQADGRVFGSEEERERVTKDLLRDRRTFQAAQNNLRSAVVGLAQIRELMGQPSETDLFTLLDTDGDGQISPDDLTKNKYRTIFGVPKKLDDDDDGVISGPQILNRIERVTYDIRERMLTAAQTLQVIQAGLRAEQIYVNRFTLPGNDKPSIAEVVKVGLENRLDLMNARAEVMDARRRLEIAANALEATLDLQVSGSVGSRAGERRPFNFDSDTSRLDIGLNLTTPLDQIQERNAYASALVAYQRARRSYMSTEDLVKNEIRRSWRQLQVADQRLEIDRQQIRQSALQYDSATLETSNPENRGDSGRGALNILEALGGLLDAQNSLISDWINYETNRLNIYRDMGIMDINPRGIWTDEFYLQSQNPSADAGLNGDSVVPEDADTPPNLPDAPPTTNEDASDENANEAPDLLPIPAPPKAAGRFKPMGVTRAGYYRGRRRTGDPVAP